jgi:hypothetical protein
MTFLRLLEHVRLVSLPSNRVIEYQCLPFPLLGRGGLFFKVAVGILGNGFRARFLTDVTIGADKYKTGYRPSEKDFDKTGDMLS